MTNTFRILLAVLASTCLFCQDTPTPFARAVALLKGDWFPPGSDPEGPPTGGFFFHPELQGKILTRRNWAQSPATKDHPASRHDDVMLIYDQAGTKPLRAFYFDNEGHAIEYTVEVTGDSVAFTSSAVPGEPRYRLTYRRTGTETLSGRFETGPAASPSAFSVTLEWTGRRAH